MSEGDADEKNRFGGPEWLWAPLVAAGATAAVAIIALLVGQPWLFPSLGPTIYLHAHRPCLASARAFNTLAGHLCGIVSAIFAVLITGSMGAPSSLATGLLTIPRATAAVLAMGVTLLLQVLARATHPPAAATALLIALGGFSLTMKDMLAIMAGILLITAIGEPLRRLRMRPHKARTGH